ncbi:MULTISPECIES: ferredoxin--NADP reductase [Asticcacaulis]|uniref:ferredoxin--NADP reductase n=1 Tax=Asticcacaulis TaxID=76890 RepID=UPI001AE2C67F|nr:MULTISPECIES: FAD-dependent oxidoreductase [Asticcacaulis]MBP2159030.1 ferredoxin-NADP reductase [Asticcacaulis solisilvae]MDR6800075.1 ferredoxin-NADP reductase [Asticcacaulis sp. BE141]
MGKKISFLDKVSGSSRKSDVIQTHSGVGLRQGLQIWIRTMDHERMRRLHGRHGVKMERVSFDTGFVSKALVANDSWEFRFERPAGFTYRAGRHVRMTLLKPRFRDRKGVTRFVSFASTPQDRDLVFVMRMRQTAFKRSLMALAPGQKVRIEMLVNAPHRAFALDDAACEPAVFLAGGIGVVPAYSMIRDALERGLPRKFYLFYSSRTAADAPFLEELQDLAAHHPSFVLVPTMTGEDASWTGRTGRIDGPLLTETISDLSTATFYIAGLPDMVADMRALLETQKVPAAQVLSEEFGGFAVAHGARQGGARLAAVGIFVAVAAAVALHLAAGAYVLRLGAIDLRNPAFAIGAAVVLAAICVKLWLVFGAGHRK